MNPKSLGVFCVLGAALMWALEPVLAKLAYQSTSFIPVQWMRVSVIALLAAGYAGMRKAQWKPSVQQFKAIVYIAFAGTLVADMIYFWALARIPSVNAVLLGHLQPVFIILLGFVVLKEEKLSRWDYAGIAAMVLAGILVSTQTIENLFSFRLGTLDDLWVLLATAIWATSTLAMRKYLTALNAGVVTFYRFGIAALGIGVYAFFSQQNLAANAFSVLLGMAGGVGTILYYEGLKRLKAAQVSALELAAPFAAALFAVIVLEESLYLLQGMGLALLVVGVYALSRMESLPKLTTPR